MGVFCYADDLSLLCPSFTGIKEMLRTCEIYADEHKILFNAKKSQLLHFTKSSTSKDTEPLKGHFLMIIIKKQAVFQINNNYL